MTYVAVYKTKEDYYKRPVTQAPRLVEKNRLNTEDYEGWYYEEVKDKDYVHPAYVWIRIPNHWEKK